MRSGRVFLDIFAVFGRCMPFLAAIAINGAKFVTFLIFELEKSLKIFLEIMKYL